ncbi:MAG TPA: putative metal-binding motif-containing protein [Polyangiaceae bacterium]|jgi:hypothetical protein
MILRFSGRARRTLVPAAVLATVVALGACSGGSGSGGSGSAFDSGTAVDTGSPGVDGSMGHDSGSGSGSGGGDATTGSDASPGAETGAGDDGGDASFGFDGFGHLDGYSEASYCPDDDGDGWTVCGGDCNDHDSLINPCAFDTNDPTDPVGTDGIDNDCDGTVDNLVTCETGLVAGHDQTPADYAHASDLCDNPMCPRLTGSLWYGTNLANAKRITGHMGTPPQFNPHQGSFMSFLSSGNAEDNTDASTYLTCPGTDFSSTFMNPMPLTAAQNVNPCGTGVDESTVAVHDYTELRMTIKAPINAGSFAFDFAFFSEEYPVYVCQGYNDTFLAIQTSAQFPTGEQIAFDANGHRINVNNAFFEDCNSCTNCVTGPSGQTIDFTHTCANPLSTLTGTGYEKLLASSSNPASQCNESKGSGGTDWLKTTSPVNPGETFTLSWIVFDEFDGILDSSVILDHFRWHSTTLGDPVTGR